jgi:hypothetical protein
MQSSGVPMQASPLVVRNSTGSVTSGGMIGNVATSVK